MMDKDYREYPAGETRTVADRQRVRKLAEAELPSHNWDEKRKAIIESGLVEERRKYLQSLGI